MGIAAYYLTHEENMRKSFSQPSRSITRMLPDGTTIDYIMNDVVDCIRISPPQRKQRAVGKNMTWDKLPPFETGTTNIDLSQMTEDPYVEGGYYCTVSVINGTDENGRLLPAEFSVEMGEDSVGWSIEQGIRQTDRSYKVDGKSATLLLGADVGGDCDIIVKDGKTILKARVGVFSFFYLGEDGFYYLMSGLHPAIDFNDGHPTKKCEETTADPFVYSNSGDYAYYRVYNYRRTTVHYVENVTGYFALLYPPKPWQVNSMWNFKYWTTAFTQTTTVVDVIEFTDPSVESSETVISVDVTNGTSYFGGYTNVFGYSGYWWEDGSAPVLPEQLANIDREDISVTNEEESIYPVNDEVEISDGVYHVLDVSILAPTPDENTSIHWTATICPKTITDTGNDTRVFFIAMYDNNNLDSKAYYWVEHILAGSGSEFVFSGTLFTEQSFEGVSMNISNVYYERI